MLASNFSTPPPGDGAYIVRNSSGTDFEKSGYFYLSYYDTSAYADGWVDYGVESSSDYEWTYQYIRSAGQIGSELRA